MTRTELIDAGKVWQVTWRDTPDDILFEGTKTQVDKYIRENHLTRAFKNGEIRKGKLIWEADDV